MNYLRTHRLKTALSQDEVADLVGLENGGNVSRHEQGIRTPELARILAYEVLYGTSAGELFREELQRHQVEIRRRAKKLHKELSKKPATAFNKRKLAALEELLERTGRKHRSS